jgi:hypothetical protein
MFGIKDGDYFVSEFNEYQQIICVTDNDSFIKRFKTAVSAKRWGNKYSHAGYGLGDFEVVPV